jgi:hypothetical protein
VYYSIIANLPVIRYCTFGQISEPGGRSARPTFSASRALPSLHIGCGCGLEDLAEPLDRAPQLGRRLHSHLSHYSDAMPFDGALAHAGHVSDLFIEQA